MSRTTVLVVVLVLALFFFTGREVVKVVKRGAVVGPVVKETAAGVVPIAPNLLLLQTNTARRAAGQSEITLDEYALARALRSEHGSASPEVRTWVAWAIKNATGADANVFRKLTRSGNPETSGFFARQITDARYAATNQAPYASDVEIAIAVLRAPKTSDPTNGATNFFSPNLQDTLFRKAQAGDPKFAKIKSDAAGLRARWAASGLASRGAPPSAPPGEVEFFGKVIA